MLVRRLRSQSDQLAEWRSITRFMRLGAAAVVPADGGPAAPTTGTPPVAITPNTPEVKAA